jgi:hypothetical protein
VCPHLTLSPSTPYSYQDRLNTFLTQRDRRLNAYMRWLETFGRCMKRLNNSSKRTETFMVHYRRRHFKHQHSVSSRPQLSLYMNYRYTFIACHVTSVNHKALGFSNSSFLFVTYFSYATARPPPPPNPSNDFEQQYPLFVTSSRSRILGIGRFIDNNQVCGWWKVAPFAHLSASNPHHLPVLAWIHGGR